MSEIVHLKKLAVGAENISSLERWQQGGCMLLARQMGYSVPFHRTRQMPKRADDIRKGGSLFWIIKRRIVVRQPIIELNAVDHEGQKFCDILLDPKLVLVTPRHHRPFQGWRYLKSKDVPSDIPVSQTNAPAGLLSELEDLGLL